MSENFLTRVQKRLALAYASGNADRTGAIMDMSGSNGITATVTMAAIAGGAVTTFKMQQGDLANGSDMSDLLGSGISIADDDDDQVFVSEIFKPTKRYVRMFMDKDGANNTAESAVYDLYGAQVMSVAGDVTDEVTVEIHISPAEGTA